MGHENSRTIKRKGRWINVTDKGKRIDSGKSYKRVEDAVRAAQTRSQNFDEKTNTQTDEFGRRRKSKHKHTGLRGGLKK